MKKIRFCIIALLLILACKERTTDADSKETAAIAKVETVEQAEWTTLFDGTSFEEWQGYLGGEVPKYWSIVDDAMVFTPPTLEERKKAGPKDYNPFNIISKKEFTSFVLSLEWKISKGGNSGVFWGIYENEKYGEPYQTALEIQVLDNQNHPDRKDLTHQAGALYDLVAPSEDATKAVGEWNTFVITVNHNTNQGNCVLNGVEVSSFPVGGAALNTLLKGSKFDGWDGFAQYKTGKIGLQDHADIVSYRNIKIKEL